MIKLRQFFIFVLCISLAWPHQLTAAVAAASSPIEPESSLYTHLINDMREQLDTSRLDFDVLIENLDYDQAQLIEFVQKQIRFEQYPGLLRGPRGTLMAGAGNTLDQAVLLAKLLRDAGIDARIARGKLDISDASGLLDQMSYRPATEATSDFSAINQMVAKTRHPNFESWVDAGTPPGSVEMVENVAQLLERALENKSPRGISPDALVEEARDYFWVEHRGTAAQTWKAVHPAFATGDAPGPIAEEYLPDSVPSSLAHQVRVIVYLERLEGEKLIVEQLTPEWKQPVANMTGRSFSIVNNPLDLPIKQDDPDFGLKLNDALGKVKLFVPLINEAVLPGSKGFDLNGVPYSMDAMEGDMFGMAALFQTVGDRFDRAAGSIAGLGNDKARDHLRYLTAQWIEYTLISPTGEERTFRRYLIDRIGVAAREGAVEIETDLQTASPRELLAGDHYIIATGALPQELVASEYFNWMEAQAFLARKRQENGQLTLRDYSEATKLTSGTEALRLLSLARRFDANLPGDQDATYRSGPALLAMHWEATGGSQVRASTDIISNDRRVHKWGDILAAQALLLRRGVWESYIERTAFSDWQTHSALQSPFSMFESDSVKPELRLWAPGTQRAEQGSRDKADAQTQLAIDASRYLVVAPDQVPDEHLAWWRIDPVTGSVIGILPDGRGANAILYAVLVTAVGFLITRSVHATGKCLDLLFQEAQMCMGSLFKTITGDTAQPYTDAYFGECFYEHFPVFNDAREEPKCRCGGISQPPCPDWHQDF